MENIYQVTSVEQTWDVARQFASELKPGDIVCLEGDLGAGKTTFTQGLAAFLGAKRAVTSPTFCLVVEHPTEKFLLVHMDLYRLQDADVDTLNEYSPIFVTPSLIIMFVMFCPNHGAFL